MKDFKKGGFKSGGFGDKRSFGGGKKFGGRDFRDKQMFQTTCSNCGKLCEVPFRPVDGRPVFCKDCFEKGRDGAPTARPNFSMPMNGRNDRNDRGGNQMPAPKQSTDPRMDTVIRQLEKVSAQLETLTRIMAKPAPEKQVVTNADATEKTKENTKAKTSDVKKSPAKKAVGKAAKKSVVKKK